MNPTFQQLNDSLANLGIGGMLADLAASLRGSDRAHEWFEVRKMQIRHRLGLPLLYSDQSDALSESQREELETGLLQACREVGMLLLEQGRLREAWNYLRPLGPSPELTETLRNIPATDDNYEQLIELCFYEGLDACRGFELLLQRFGTCNAITTLHAQARNLPVRDRQATATMLVDHLYQELSGNVRSHIEKHEGSAPAMLGLSAMLQPYDWLFSERSYHIDTSHLSSTVQLARVAIAPHTWQKAWELTDYGRRLDRELQYPSEAPFEDTYVAHGHFFAALLDRDRETALAYFAERARQCDVYHYTTFAVEVYIDLLSRVGRAADALQVYLELIPADAPTTGLVTSPLHLAEISGNFTPLLEYYQAQDRLLEYGAALALAALQKT